MKPVRVLAIALLGYAALLIPGVSQASSVVLSAPGISVRLPAPSIPILLPPGVSIREERGYGYRVPAPPPRYYRESWHRERWDDRRHGHDDHGHSDHGRDGWHR